jgi:hypothetical protein
VQYCSLVRGSRMATKKPTAHGESAPKVAGGVDLAPPQRIQAARIVHYFPHRAFGRATTSNYH